MYQPLRAMRASPGYVPIVYVEPPTSMTTHPRWEYQILNIDLRETPPPDAERLAGLGAEGWLLAGILPQQHHVVYYFVRAALV